MFVVLVLYKAVIQGLQRNNEEKAVNLQPFLGIVEQIEAGHPAII